MNSLYPKRPIPVAGWDREEHFKFFRHFTQPFFNVQTEVDITPIYHYCKQEQLSVFLAYVYITLISARSVENFLLRFEEEQVVRYSAVDVSTTVLKNNNTFAFVHLPYQNTLNLFCREGAKIIAAVKKSTHLFHGYNGPDLLHLTTLPWFKLNGLQHAFTLNPDDAIPKIAFGQLEHQSDKVILPLNVSLHHALADGYHVHLLLQEMERQIHLVTPMPEPVLSEVH